MVSRSPVAVACCCPAEAAVFLLRERREVSSLIQTAEAERGGEVRLGCRSEVFETMRVAHKY